MKINEMIKEKRMALGLTQEQTARYLGVSAPAVNKWEKGTSFPDITLLPPLARLLKTDLNTLLSFHEELTREEIGAFLNTLSEEAAVQGFEKIYMLAMEKIGEYPNCYLLLLNTALTLSGLLMIHAPEKAAEYEEAIEELYVRALGTDDSAIKNQACACLISAYTGRKEYERAEKLLNELPEEQLFNKQQFEINLHIAKGELSEAAKQTERKLLKLGTGDIYWCLITLVEIAVKEERWEDAERFAEIFGKASELLELPEYNLYIVQFQVAAAKKDKEAGKVLLDKLLHALDRTWDMTSGTLYKHLANEQKRDGENGMERLKQMILNSIEADEAYEFLREE